MSKENTTDCTPPADIPDQVIMMEDTDFGRRHPDKAFYLRLKVNERDVDFVDLGPGIVTPLGARARAKELGYSPAHWCRVSDGSVTQFY
jgi:hypothetical protein